MNPILRQTLSIIRYPKVFLFSKRMGKNNHFGPHGHFLHPEEIFFGDNVYIGPYFYISARNLKFGNNIMIGPRLLLECDDHVFDNVGKTIWSTRNERKIGYVTIEDDVWIGGNVTILKNVKISEGAIIGAGSLIIRDLPPYSICVGSPCKAVKPRFTPVKLAKHLKHVASKYSLDEILDFWEKNKII